MSTTAFLLQYVSANYQKEYVCAIWRVWNHFWYCTLMYVIIIDLIKNMQIDEFAVLTIINIINTNVNSI
jgi:hypothetical protein